MNKTNNECAPKMQPELENVLRFQDMVCQLNRHGLLLDATVSSFAIKRRDQSGYTLVCEYNYLDEVEKFIDAIKAISSLNE